MRFCPFPWRDFELVGDPLCLRLIKRVGVEFRSAPEEGSDGKSVHAMWAQGHPFGS